MATQDETAAQWQNVNNYLEFFFKSSNIYHASFNNFYGLLYITFNNGRRYMYRGIPYKVFNEFCKATSAGTYFHTVIRDKFKYEEVSRAW